MHIGAQVSMAGGMLAAFARAEPLGAEVIQIFTQSPRQWRPSARDPQRFAAYRALQHDSSAVAATYCHATYLINLATANAALVEASEACLVENLTVATMIGASGVVLHVGSHLGRGLDAVLAQVAASLTGAMDAVERELGEASCPILLENTAGAGGTIGRSFAELARVIDAAGGDARLGTCLDTQHLFASGVSFATPAEADEVVADIAATVGLARLCCMHVNDSKVTLGANRDRHENLGEGTIGEAGFTSLLGHPDLDGVPAILEVPGAGQGPRAEDVAQAKALHAAGVAGRASAAPTRRLPPTPRRAPGARAGSRPDPTRAGGRSPRSRSR